MHPLRGIDWTVDAAARMPGDLTVPDDVLTRAYDMPLTAHCHNGRWTARSDR